MTHISLFLSPFVRLLKYVLLIRVFWARNISFKRLTPALVFYFAL